MKHPGAEMRRAASPSGARGWIRWSSPCCAALLTLACALPASAGEAFIGLGSTGFELGMAHKLSPNIGLRGELSVLNYRRNFNSDGADYQASLKFSNFGAYGDYFLTSHFRLTGGVLLGTRKVQAHGVTTGGTVTINGTAYAAPPGESVDMVAKFPGAAPYFGLGFGHGQAKPGLGLYFDAGAAFGKSEVTVTATPGLLAAAGQGNVDAERTNVQEKFNQIKAYPVLKLGLTYTY